MSRVHSEREDLFAEAAGLAPRVEIGPSPLAQAIVAGRRKHDGWSIYFDSDPCYHFDAAGGLRRAFVAGRLLRSDGDCLAELTRSRTSQATELRRRDLAGEELRAFLADLHARVEALQRLLHDDAARITRQHPAGIAVLPALGDFLNLVRLRAEPLAPRVVVRR